MNRIRKLRKEKKLTLKEASEELKKNNINISADALSKYERGDREPKLEAWQKLADFFNVPVPYLQGVSSIKSLEQVSTMENFAKSVEPIKKKDVKASIYEMRELSKAWQLATFTRINKAILNHQNMELSGDEVEKYRKVVADFDAKNLVDTSDINFHITQLYLIMLNAIQGKSKDKEAFEKISKIICEYLGIWDEMQKDKD